MTKRQIGVILAALVLVVVLYSMRTTPLKDGNNDVVTVQPKDVEAKEFNLSAFMDQQKATLNDVQLNELDKLTSKNNDQVGNAEQQLQYYSTLSTFWSNLNNTFMTAYYAKKEAELENTSTKWAISAKEYYNVFSTYDAVMINEYALKMALSCYDKALEIDPLDLNIKADMAMCLIDDPNEPMKGIKVLLDIVKSNPNHIVANLNLGKLSIRSGQYEKAVSRFETVINNEPDNQQAYLDLINVYEMLGNSEKVNDYKEQLETLRTKS
ncbi:MAG: hypothetical protein JKY33_04645 [Bacteroidia bacterium]|nr:hypothetical protein [Bacteroidia bacterium]